MGPPGWAKIYDLTDDPKYLDFMIKEWKATSAFLYDPEEHLYFRDKSYFPDRKKEKNGKKVFWGRGNGWVLGGLIRVLQVLPDNHPERAFFVTQFQQMCNKMIAIQPADGVWRASLLDPDNYPIQETSSTSFICYALAWGVNQGLLSQEKAEPALRKAIGVLCTFITPEGKLTHVQPIGADPQKFDVEKTGQLGIVSHGYAEGERACVRHGEEQQRGLLSGTHRIDCLGGCSEKGSKRNAGDRRGDGGRLLALGRLAGRERKGAARSFNLPDRSACQADQAIRLGLRYHARLLAEVSPQYVCAFCSGAQG
jgi:hypothetical protein